MKSLRDVFRNSKKKKTKAADLSSEAPIKSSISSPTFSHSSAQISSNGEADDCNITISKSNTETGRSVGQHSNASSINRSGLDPAEGSPIPAVPALPPLNSPSSVVDLSGYAQPQSTALIATASDAIADTGTMPSTSTVDTASASFVRGPSNPQLTEGSPLVRTINALSEIELDGDSRPTERDPRGPQAIQSGTESTIDTNVVSATSTTVDLDGDELSALHCSGTLPPSYNSLNIPLNNRTNMHTASAPSPDMVNNTAVREDPTGLDDRTTPTNSVPYISPPPPTTSQLDSSAYHNNLLPPLPNQPPMQAYQQPYAMPPSSSSNNGNWSAQQAYSPAASGSQNYGHRPYVIPGNENQVYPIIMAIDWGTTFSSMAYAYQQDGEVHEVSTWPKQTHSYPKVPTCNLYAPGSKDILEWGYPAKLAITKPPFKNHVLLSKYKLHLDDASGPHPPLPNGLTVIDAIADYLRLFHAHVVQSVLKGFGAAFEQQHIQYCLSVPAMWTDNAKAMMRQAALQAGMITPLDPPHRLLLISEPEAAALYCEKKCDQFQIGHGQRFMICDAGGGTVDLIVFEVAVGPQGRTLREVTRGSGHSCGSIFLDERMEALLRRRFSKWQEKGLSAANWIQLMDTFVHNVKPLFDGIEDQYLTMPAVPGRADLTDYDIGLEDGILTVSAEEMRREVFDPVINDVLRLIQHQLQQTHFQCHAIFLVGGFGCSSYLHTRVKSEFGSHVPMIGVPPRAELAVVRGAAYAGLMPRTITQRVARRWYGVDSLMAFEEGVDMPHKKAVDREGVSRARDRFSFYVTPGQQIGVDECITKRYITYQYPRPVNSPLFASSSMTLPRYVDSPLVEKIGDFLIPLPFVPGAQPGHKIAFELRMYFGMTEIRAEAEVNGVVVSTRCQFAG
ncbi:Heat shock 70 kDa protein 12A [Mortierella polycephala]|uniref:Heat shock 70 kDa protein 12A n=1 Tax=Mortierella polycephala TaxID=41804 RepID=A0A9P6QB15_9FUNG|nr:Heat shock 70 kDa protein 12A [Mortierella polycephala]